jgi:hypothetical protein
MVAHNGRIWGISSDEPGIIWVSEPVSPGVAPVFTPESLVTVEDLGEGFTAITGMDDKVVAFSRTGVFILPQNASGGYAAITRLSMPHGCTSAGSVAVTSRGVVFQSEAGIMLLGRDLSLSPIGEAVEDTLEGRTVVRSIQVPDKNQIRMLLDDGSQLVYQFNMDKWSTLADRSTGVYDIGVGNGNTYRVGDSLYIERDYSTAFNIGTVNTETDMSFTTGWFNLDNISGFYRLHKIQIHGTLIEGTITVSVGYNNETAFTDVETFSGLGENFTISLKPSRQKCRNFRLKLQENSSAVALASDGFYVTGVTIEVSQKGPMFKHYSRNNQR